MIYDIYHEETKEEGFGHIIYFVPLNHKNTIIESFLASKPEKPKDYSLKNIKPSTFPFAKSTLGKVIASLQKHQGKKEIFSLPQQSYDTRMKRRHYETKYFSNPMKCKLAIFWEQNGVKGDYDEYVQRTFRIALQGACHYLFGENDPIEIRNIYFDGFEHYNSLDTTTILKEFDYKSRSYCSLNENAMIIDGKMDEQNESILEAIDIFLGVFRIHRMKKLNTALTSMQEKKHNQLFPIIKPFLKRFTQGKRRLQNSRFENSFCYTEASRDKQWNYFEGDLHSFLETPPKHVQNSLFDTL